MLIPQIWISPQKNTTEARSPCENLVCVGGLGPVGLQILRSPYEPPQPNHEFGSPRWCHVSWRPHVPNKKTTNQSGFCKAKRPHSGKHSFGNCRHRCGHKPPWPMRRYLAQLGHPPQITSTWWLGGLVENKSSVHLWLNPRCNKSHSLLHHSYLLSTWSANIAAHAGTHWHSFPMHFHFSCDR